jgi:ABC-type nitrate/sulfonate/bicarbonate transport system permease component
MIGGLARKSSFYVLVIMIWEVASRVGVWPRFLFPAPSEVLQTLLQGFADRTFIFGILASLRRILLGYSISLVAGVLLGLGISRNKVHCGNDWIPNFGASDATQHMLASPGATLVRA